MNANERRESSSGEGLRSSRARRTAISLCLAGAALTAGNAQPLEEHYLAAGVAVAAGDTARGKRELKLALWDNPLHAEAHFLLASLLAREGDLDEAIAGYLETLALNPNHAPARYNLGTALLWRSEWVAAARQFEEALAVEPDHVPTYNNLAKAYFLAGMPELAVASYREALRRDPANAVARQSLARLTGKADGSQRPLSEGSLPFLPNTTPPDLTGSALLLAATAGQPDPVPAPHALASLEADPGANAGETIRELRELVRDLPHVTVEWRGRRLALAGWTSGPGERKLLDKIVANRADVLDLTTDDNGDPHRLLEVDATIFKILGMDSESAGHNFLRRVSVNASLADGALAAWNWLYTAAISYEVSIANASEQRVAFLARPHLTTLSGTPAKFTAGGDIVYQVAGLNSGDIKPYPFGTTLEVTPTLLRTRGERGLPRIRLAVVAGRRTILPITDFDGVPEDGATVFENVSVTSEAVLDLNQTLILTGLNQREQRTRRSGVPGLRSIPIIKYLFSEKIITTSDLAIIILLTPRDPAFWDSQTKQATAAFVQKRRAFVQASRGTEEDLRRFKEQYPDWDQLAPNRFASHFFLMENSDTYRRVNGIDLASEDLDFELLGKKPKQKKAKP